MRHLLNFIFLLLTSLSANEYIQDNINYKTSYLVDKNDDFSLKYVQEKTFLSSTKEMSLNPNNLVVWYKFEIENRTYIDKKAYLHSDLAYMSKDIEIYEFDETHQLDQNRYNLLEEEVEEKLVGSSVIYGFTLKSKTKKILYLKNRSLVHQLVSFNVYDELGSKSSLLKKDFVSIFIVSILIALALYNVLLFTFSGHKLFIYYSLYLINAAIGLFYMYGLVFSTLSIYGSRVYWLNITAILVPLFLILFVQSAFEVKKISPFLNKLLNAVVFLSILDVVIALTYSLEFAMQIVPFIFLVNGIVLFSLGSALNKINHALTKIFISAYSVYLLGMGMTILSFMGIISLNTFTFYASGIGLVVEVLMFSYILHYHTQLLQKEINTQQQILVLQKKKAQMGDMIGAISHQWKQPLNAINSTVMLLQYRLKDQDQLSSESLKPKLEEIEQKISFLKKTIDDFRHFFHPQSKANSVDLAVVVKQAVDLSHENMLSAGIALTTDLRFENSFEIYENELLHIILNLLENSKDAFMINEIKNRLIKIIGRTKNGKNIIEIIDNAGGIKDEDFPHIFDEFYTTKKEYEGSGLGLYLSKLIIKEHMNGDIEVQRLPKGTIFRIII